MMASVESQASTVTGSRHPWNARLCDLLQQVVWGKCAASALGESRPTRSVAVATLPVFIWKEPKVGLGRKSRARDGGQMLFPHRVVWTQLPTDACPDPVAIDPLIVLGAQDACTLAWTADAAGNQLSGTIVVQAVPGGSDKLSGALPCCEMPEVLYVPTLPRHKAVARLRELVETGNLARWNALMAVEDHLHYVFDKAHSSVSIELYPTQNRSALDNSALESVLNEMLLGCDGSDTSVIFRLLDRCLSNEAFRHVDPQKYINSALFSASETAIRRRLGDPHIGRKIRKFAEGETLRTREDVQEFIDAYNAHYPNDNLAVTRASRALTVREDLFQTVPFDTSVVGAV